MFFVPLYEILATAIVKFDAVTEHVVDVGEHRGRDGNDRLPHTRRYQLMTIGRRLAVLFTETYGRVLAPGLGVLDPRLPDAVAGRSPLAVAWHRFESALDDFIKGSLVG